MTAQPTNSSELIPCEVAGRRSHIQFRVEDDTATHLALEP